MKHTDYTRLGWDEYFIEIVKTVGLRGSCDRGRAGAVVTRDNRIIMTGYAGAPSGLPDCDEAGHQMQERTHADSSTSKHCVRTIHAEENTILHAARFGVSLTGATIYCKMMPCINCARQIYSSGITRIVALRDYHASKPTKELFDAVNLDYTVLIDAEEAYENK